MTGSHSVKNPIKLALPRTKVTERSRACEIGKFNARIVGPAAWAAQLAAQLAHLFTIATKAAATLKTGKNKQPRDEQVAYFHFLPTRAL